jgi:PIN domain nuclease of toxin-antitoxin system
MRRCEICLRRPCRGRSRFEKRVQAIVRYGHAVHVTVAELPAAVTDTHALLFHSAASRALGRRAAAHFEACEHQQALAYVPMAVIWEISLLARASRVNLRRPVRDFFGDLFSNPSYHPIDLSTEQVFLADELRFTRDPFDALIVAAARSIDLPLLTRDTDIRASGTVRVIW